MSASIRPARLTAQHCSPCVMPRVMSTRLRIRRASLALLAIALAHLGDACADAYLTPIGGGGGGQFIAPCSANEVLVGFELRAGDDVDAIRPLCAVAQGPHHVGAPYFTTDSGLIRRFSDANREVFNNYSEILGDWTELAPGWYGGVGGGITRVVCPSNQPVVTGMFVAAEGVDTVVVNNIHLFCGFADATSPASEFPAAVFDAPNYRPTSSTTFLGVGGGGDHAQHDDNTQRCPRGDVAVGVHGRSGRWLDAIGLICAEPPFGPPGKTLGRVASSKPPPPHPAGWTICDSARDARARNSPAAANLEAQCARLPAKTLGRVSGRTPSSPHPAGWTICDSARDARSRNSPAAPNLEAQCRARGEAPPPAAPPDPPEPDPAPDDGA